MAETSKQKKWSEMNSEEKLKAMPEFKKTVENQIKALKKKLADEKIKLKSLENEEKALKFEVLANKAKEKGKNIEDLI